MDNLQTEVLELEFHEYSKGMKFICEVDFAKILLRNTTLTEQEYSSYIDRLKARIKVPRGMFLVEGATALARNAIPRKFIIFL